MRKVASMAMLAIVLLAGCGAVGGAEPANWHSDSTRPVSARTPGHPAAADRAAVPSPSPTPTPSPSGTPSAHKATYGKRVGALFTHDLKGEHFCTASVVDGPGRNLIITAAHCLHEGKGGEYYDDLVFVPGYRDGKAPYGVWRVRGAVVDDRWKRGSDQDLDVGFAVVEPLNGRNIADVLGSNALGLNAGFHNVVRVTGYPMHSEEPITCVNATTREDTYQLRFACKGYFPGTSGSPWLAGYDPRTGRGTVVGVIGGYHEGGNVDAVSYSSYFDDDVRLLYEQAVRQSTPK